MKTSEAIMDIPVDPELPEGLWSTPHDQRPAAHMAMWGKPFVQRFPNPFFPTGYRFDVYCLDGGVSDRPTCWGMFGSLEEAIQRAQEAPPWGDHSAKPGGMKYATGW